MLNKWITGQHGWTNSILSNSTSPCAVWLGFITPLEYPKVGLYPSKLFNTLPLLTDHRVQIVLWTQIFLCSEPPSVWLLWAVNVAKSMLTSQAAFAQNSDATIKKSPSPHPSISMWTTRNFSSNGEVVLWNGPWCGNLPMVGRQTSGTPFHSSVCTGGRIYCSPNAARPSTLVDIDFQLAAIVCSVLSKTGTACM